MAKVEMHTLRCFAEGCPGRWEAICLEFDIAVQGRSLEEVFHSLNSAIALYIEAAGELPQHERDMLLRRRAPLSLRVKFLMHIIGAVIFGRVPRGGKERADFVIPCAT